DAFSYGYQPMYFKGKMVYMTRLPYEGDGTIQIDYQTIPVMRQLLAFDGTNATSIDIPPLIRNFTVDGSYIYVLARDGEVRRTSDLSLPWAQWESFSGFTDSDLLRTSRKASNSIALLNGRMYIGSSEAQ